MSPYYQQLRNAVGQETLVIPAVAALIHDADGRLLLQEKHDGSWSLPAGAIEPGETPEMALRREVPEETGLECESADLVDVLGGEDFRFTYPNGDKVEYVIVVYACTTTQRAAQPFDESETRATRYFSRENFPGLALPYSMDMLYPAPSAQE